jgi:hypothetical protein
MQLGTRWAVGRPARGSLPEAMRAAVTAVEKELAAADQDTKGWAWTLTYLEGRPIVDLDDGTRVRMVPGEDTALITSVDLDADRD